MICDSHCHLDDKCYGEDLEEVLSRAREVGITRFIIPAAHPEDLQRAQKIANQYEDVYFAVGIHPDLCREYDKKGERFFTDFLADRRCIAVGECGLDYYRMEEKCSQWGMDTEEIKDLQRKVFLAQILWASHYNKPLIVHIREASQDSLNILYDACVKKPSLRGVLHCFNADGQLLKLSQQFYYGIGGVLTFKNARKLVEVLPKIPLNRLLLETDAPYLTPHPHRGSRNEPSYIPLVLEKMAEILQKPYEVLEEQITQNNKELFGI